MNQLHHHVRTVPAAKVSEWLVWLGQRSTQDPRDTESRRLSNRLYESCRRAGAPDTVLAARGMSTATTAAGAGGVPGFDWTTGEIPFAPRPGFGGKTIERMITRVVAVTHIRE